MNFRGNLKPISGLVPTFAFFLVNIFAISCGGQEPAFTTDEQVKRQSADVEGHSLPPEPVDGVEGLGDGGTDAGVGQGGDDGGWDGSSDGGIGDGFDDGGTGIHDDGTDDGTGDGADDAGGPRSDGSGDGDDDLVKVSIERRQQSPGTADILWIVDSSASMSEEQSYLGDNFSAFIRELTAIGLNFQTAITSTDICHDDIPDDLSKRYCPVDYGGNTTTHLRGRFVGARGRQVLKSDQGDIVSKFSEHTHVGVNGSGFEHGMKAAQMAIAKVMSGENDPLVRDNAFLSIIVVSDEEDDGIGLAKPDGYNGNNFHDQGLTTFSYTADQFINYLDQVKGSGNFAISTITGTSDRNGQLCRSTHSAPSEEGTQYITAASKTGGMVQSICEDDWDRLLGNIGFDLTAQINQIKLTSRPADPDKIRVYVDATETPHWTYHSGSNSIKFDPDHIPREGAEIRIDYWKKP